ncbi:MAG: hypothetical protein AAGD25_40775 [Cyanobacteria bacterium P01_F01_bin.150]
MATIKRSPLSHTVTPVMAHYDICHLLSAIAPLELAYAAQWGCSLQTA